MRGHHFLLVLYAAHFSGTGWCDHTAFSAKVLVAASLPGSRD